ncbi:MAG: hypothetical protein U5M51_10700 [Emticicia sp.]|nr:hypothetical protein [Emticicia sp.]
MKTKKETPKVDSDKYKVNPALDSMKFEFTPETQIFRLKVEKFIKSHIKMTPSI